MKNLGDSLDMRKNKQELEPLVHTYSGKEFINTIKKWHHVLEDPRFFDFEKTGGAFRFLDVSDIVYWDIVRAVDKHFLSTVRIGGEIVAIGQLQKAPNYEGENTYYMSFVSVDPKYQGNGYASQALEELFRFAAENKFRLINSSYNTDGQVKLQKKNLEFAAKYHVDFVDSKRLYN